MNTLYPLRLQPILQQYIWGGRRLESLLGKSLEPGDHYAESWEICDLGTYQSVVQSGALVGTTLGDLVVERGAELLGRHHPQTRFPLLLKFLDAALTLSVQVHPDDARAALLEPPDFGKTEAWFVLAAEPGSTIHAGLKAGVDRKVLAEAIRAGTCEDCLHSFHPNVGDSVLLPAGTVHALGEGLVVAEVQQPSDVTYRLFDFNRVGPDGKPRQLHVEQGLEAIDYNQGQIEPHQPRPTDQSGVCRLVECDKFMLDRRDIESPQMIGGDQRCHIVSVLEGALQLGGDPSGGDVLRGETVLLAAELGQTELIPQDRAVLLDAYLP